MTTAKKKILVTGASSGIGRATAAALAKQGHSVMMAARRIERLQSAASELGSTVQIAELDVRDPASIAAFTSTHAGWLKDLDVLVNNAGLALGREGVQESDPEDFATVIDTNVTGLLRVTRALLPNMIARKRGQIVNLGSVAARTPYAGGTVYCASKAAVHMITDSLRIDLGGTGIRVCTISPGRVAETEFSEVRFRGDKDKASQVYEGYRIMTSADVANAIAWVIQQPEHVNVQELVILPTDQPSATALVPLKT